MFVPDLFALRSNGDILDEMTTLALAIRSRAPRTPSLLLVISGMGLALAASPARAEGNYAAAAHKEATKMYDAFLRGDLDTFVTYMHPKAVSLVGGKKKVMEAIEKLQVDLRANGLKLLDATASPPIQVIASRAHGIQVIIPTEMIFASATRRLHQPSFLWGLSTDEGKTWKFTDTGQVGAEAMRKYFPECSPELAIPARPKPYESTH